MSGLLLGCLCEMSSSVIVSIVMLYYYILIESSVERLKLVIKRIILGIRSLLVVSEGR